MNPLRVRFVRHVAMTGGAQAVQAAAAMVAGIMVARVLGADAKGTLSVLTALGAMCMMLGSFGVQLSGVYFLGRFKSERDAVLSNNLLVAVVGGTLAAAALALVGVAFRHEVIPGIDVGLFLLFTLSVPFYYFNQFARSLLLGLGRVGRYNIPEALSGAALLIGTASAILVFGEHLEPLIGLRIAIEVGVAALVAVWVRRAARFRWHPSLAMLKRQLAYGLRNYASSLLWMFLLQIDIVLCNHFLGNATTGIYSVAVSLGLPITMLAGIVGVLTFQRVSAEDSRPVRIAQTNRAARVLLPLAAVGIALIGLLAQWLIPLVYGQRFDPAGVALLLLLPGFLVYSVEMVLMNFLAGEGSPPIIVWAPLTGLAINVVANLFVIPRWGINGASVTSSVAYGVVLLLVAQYYRRSTGSSLRDTFVVRGSDLAGLLGRRGSSGRAEAQAA
jgi:O-antigen/teichoic acid export membrane protein